MNHGLSFISSMAMSGYTVFHANGCNVQQRILNVQHVIRISVVTVLYFGERSLSRLWEIVVVVEQTLMAT